MNFQHPISQFFAHIKSYTLLFLLLFISLFSTAFADNTDGSTVQIDPAKFKHVDLTKLIWTAQIFEYDYAPRDASPYRLRIDFSDINLIGQKGTISFRAGTLQNTGHRFPNDAYGRILTIPELGLYFSSLATDLPDSKRGVRLIANPELSPFWGRCFENVDGGGVSGKNIYTRSNIGAPSLATPVVVKFTVTKGATVTNPTENLSKDIQGNWVPLVGTFTTWKVSAEINGRAQEVAEFYFPTEIAEFINGSNPLTFYQEHFGSDERILQAQKCTVRFVDIRASNGTSWFDLLDWVITRRIDNKADSMNLDNRFGWKTDGVALISRAGHEEDIRECSRDLEAKFHLSSTQTISVKGGTGSFSLSPPVGFAWTAKSNNPDWLFITAGGTGNGAGTVSFFVSNNSTFHDRVGTISVAGQTITIKQQGPFLGKQLPLDFNDEGWLLEDYEMSTATALKFIGIQSYQAGSATNTGPVYSSPLNFGYVMLDTTRQLLLLHPIKSDTDRVISIGFAAPQDGFYTFTGAFARANNGQYAGDGVDVLAFKNNAILTPLFRSSIASSNPVNADDPFAGPGVAPFSFSLALTQGEIVRFAVSAGRNHDAAFDLTALRLMVRFGLNSAIGRRGVILRTYR